MSEWTRTYLGKINGADTWMCAEPPCWLLIEDMMRPEINPWTHYWDGHGYPLNCTSYRIIGFCRTPLPELPDWARRASDAASNARQEDK